MSEEQSCPKCNSQYPYQDGATWNCPECFHEWTAEEASQAAEAVSAEETGAVLDSNGNPLQDGDSVSIVKDLKVKGASSSLKVGTKVKNIRLVPDSPDGHNISCTIKGFGSMGLKSEFVKKG